MIKIVSKPKAVTLEILAPLVVEFEDEEDFQRTIEGYENNYDDLFRDCGVPSPLMNEELYEYIDIMEISKGKVELKDKIVENKVVEESVEPTNEYFY